MRSSLLFKAAIIVLCGDALIVGAVPLGLYWFGLSNIDEEPVPPARTDDLGIDTALLQRDFRNQLPILVYVLNPWTFMGELRAGNAATPDNGAHVVWIVVQKYNSKHLKNHKMTWWHLSGAALTIWMTRNWTRDEIVAAAAAIVRSYPRRPSAG